MEGGAHPLSELTRHTTSLIATGRNPAGNLIAFREDEGQEEIAVQASNDYRLLVKHDLDITTNGTHRTQTTSNQHETIGGDSLSSVAGSCHQTVGRDFVLKSKGRVVIDAEEIVLRAGGSSAVFSCASVNLIGGLIKFNCSGGSPASAAVETPQQPTFRTIS